MAAFDSKQDLSALLEVLNDRRKLQGDKIALESGFSIDEETLLPSFMKLPVDLSLNDASEIVSKAIFSTRLPLGFSQSELSRVCRDIYHEQRRSKKFEFLVFTHFTMDDTFPTDPFIEGKTEIDLSIGRTQSVRSKLYEQHAAELAAVEEDSQNRIHNFQGRAVIARIKATNAKAGFVTARKSLDKFRGALNLAINLSQLGRRTFGSTTRAVNTILNSKFSTVHDEEGIAIKNSVWFERDWIAPTKLFQYSKIDEVRRKRFSDVLGYMKTQHGLSELAHEGLIRYCRALDSTNWQYSFLELWSVLEFLCCIDSNQNHDTICTRVCALYADKELTRLYMNHLKIRRNGLVHAGYEIEERYAEQILYQLNRYVSRVLYFVLSNALELNSKDELREFLDLNLDVARLQRRRRIINSAIEFRRPRTIE